VDENRDYSAVAVPAWPCCAFLPASPGSSLAVDAAVLVGSAERLAKMPQVLHTC
jgi:hypothetical protein